VHAIAIGYCNTRCPGPAARLHYPHGRQACSGSKRGRDYVICPCSRSMQAGSQRTASSLANALKKALQPCIPRLTALDHEQIGPDGCTRAHGHGFNVCKHISRTGDCRVRRDTYAPQYKMHNPEHMHSVMLHPAAKAFGSCVCCYGQHNQVRLEGRDEHSQYRPACACEPDARCSASFTCDATRSCTAETWLHGQWICAGALCSPLPPPQ
jgi:hypothetical protein